jgi:D-alanyl-D-alanine carboxypeptidase (penicillin-binding protein 5/6)
VQLYPASLTKVMTALVAIKYGTPEQMLYATDAIRIDDSGAQLCGLKPGDSMTLNQALYIALLHSANDAALMIAENISGSVDEFVKLMNEKVKELGLKNTNFVNSTGLDADNHYSTAYDMAMMAKELIRHEKILEFSSIYEDYLRKNTDNSFWLVNTNKVVYKNYYSE